MKELTFKSDSGDKRIIVGAKLFALTELCPTDDLFIITDNNVAELYSEQFPKAQIIVIPAGEKFKTIRMVENIAEQLLNGGCSRQSFIVGIGGGIITDIVGFTASVYMRGICFGFVPTTLLAQTDASIGGKNGVNLKKYKNMLGVFNPPEFILIDSSTLNTLPKREIKSGFAEIIKAAALGGGMILEYVKSFKLGSDTGNPSIDDIILEAVKFKLSIVERDFKESGSRAILNFGHTFGHALEKTIHSLTHGEAVSIGISAALFFSMRNKLITENESNEILKLLEDYELPIQIDFNADEILAAMLADKKKSRNGVDYILLSGIGKPYIYKSDYYELREWLYDLHIAWNS